MDLPEPDLEGHSQFVLEPGALRQWLAQLPRANVGLTTRALYQAVLELNRVHLSARRRSELMSELQSAIDAVCTSLRRHYLNQPTLLPEQPRRVARLVEALHEGTGIGWALTARDAAGSGQHATATGRLLAGATSRALEQHLSALLLRFQLYQPLPPRQWLTIHGLYRHACQHRAETLTAGKLDSPRAMYLRCLLLAGASPNQLRQQDLEALFQRLEQWTDSVSLVPGAPGDCVLVVDPDSGEGPLYRTRAGQPGPRWFGLDLRRLVAHLRHALEQPGGDPQRDLLLHLIHAWTEARSRQSMRIETRETLHISLGLSATHHFLCGEEDFQVFLHGDQPQRLVPDQENPFLRGNRPTPAPRSHDVWDRPYRDQHAGGVSVETIDYNIRQHQKGQTRKPEPYQLHTVTAINASPFGYCLQWPAQKAIPLRSGELIGLQRAGDAAQWMIASIRWVQLTPEGPITGVELLSPAAIPFAARILQHGEMRGEFQRVLVLPEVRTIGQPTTLIAPRLPFREGDKVLLLQYGDETRVQLMRQVASAGAYNQFEFRRQMEARAASPPAEDNGFEGIWDKL